MRKWRKLYRQTNQCDQTLRPQFRAILLSHLEQHTIFTFLTLSGCRFAPRHREPAHILLAFFSTSARSTRTRDVVTCSEGIEVSILIFHCGCGYAAANLFDFLPDHLNEMASKGTTVSRVIVITNFRVPLVS